MVEKHTCPDGVERRCIAPTPQDCDYGEGAHGTPEERQATSERWAKANFDRNEALDEEVLYKEAAKRHHPGLIDRDKLLWAGLLDERERVREDVEASLAASMDATYNPDTDTYVFKHSQYAGWVNTAMLDAGIARLASQDELADLDDTVAVGWVTTNHFLARLQSGPRHVDYAVTKTPPAKHSLVGMMTPARQQHWATCYRDRGDQTVYTATGFTQSDVQDTLLVFSQRLAEERTEYTSIGGHTDAFSETEGSRIIAKTEATHKALYRHIAATTPPGQPFDQDRYDRCARLLDHVQHDWMSRNMASMNATDLASSIVQHGTGKPVARLTNSSVPVGALGKDGQPLFSPKSFTVPSFTLNSRGNPPGRNITIILPDMQPGEVTTKPAPTLT